MSQRPARRAFARLSVVAFVTAAVAAGLSGCVPSLATPPPDPSPSGYAAPRAVAPLAPLVVPAVLVSCPLLSPVHYDGYWLPVDEVFICRADEQHDTDGVTTYGPWETSYRIPHPEALLRAYRAPNARLSDPALCPMAYQDPLLVWVHHNGVTAAYYAPVDGCGDPSKAAREAYDSAGRVPLITVDRGAPQISQKDSQG